MVVHIICLVITKGQFYEIQSFNDVLPPFIKAVFYDDGVKVMHGNDSACFDAKGRKNKGDDSLQRPGKKLDPMVCVAISQGEHLQNGGLPILSDVVDDQIVMWGSDA